MNGRDTTELDSGGSCATWQEAAEELIVKAPGSQTPSRSELLDHLAICDACRSSLAPLVETHESLERAFDALGLTLPRPDEARVRRIVVDSTAPRYEAALLRRLRRPINTMLWFTFIAFTVGALAALAFALAAALLRE